MDKKYMEISEDLIKNVKRYIKDEISYNELRRSFVKEDLLYNCERWNETEMELRKNIFEFENDMYKHLLEVEEKIKKYEADDQKETVEIEIDDITSHAIISSRNQAPPSGYGNSTWYLPFIPNYNIMDALYDEEDQISSTQK